MPMRVIRNGKTPQFMGMGHTKHRASVRVKVNLSLQEMVLGEAAQRMAAKLRIREALVAILAEMDEQ